MDLNPENPGFYDKEALKEETLRVFDICNSCRLCFFYCGSFPYLFDALDRKDQDVKRLSDDEISKVEELCFQCKICYFECPYHPPHKYMLDFPRLILRLAWANARSEGVKLNDTLLGATETLGKIGSLFPFAMNLANRSRVLRNLSGALTGIHPDRKLPEFRFITFERWWNRRERERENDVSSGHGHAEKKAALFYTCTVNYNRPETGIAAVKVLEHNGVRVAAPRQRCCGMPRLDGGDVAAALEQVRENTMNLIPYVNQGYDIIGLGPTCTYMLKFEYRELFPCEETEKIAERTFDICEYLMKLDAAGGLKRDFRKGAG
ncbi:MAG: ferredoxin, partial [Deltaproteobacteria bacterium]|nr:ferredoxin [Deltaproteobacteria bacterium]